VNEKSGVDADAQSKIWRRARKHVKRHAIWDSGGFSEMILEEIESRTTCRRDIHVNRTHRVDYERFTPAKAEDSQKTRHAAARQRASMSYDESGAEVMRLMMAFYY